VLTCLQAPFIPPQRLIAAVSGAIVITTENSLPPLLLNHSHRAVHLMLEGGDRSLTATVQRSSTVTVFSYAHLHCNCFQLHVPPLQELTVTARTSEVIAGSCRRTTASRSSTSQVPRSTIQILQSQTILILEPVNPAGGDSILDATTHVPLRSH